MFCSKCGAELNDSEAEICPSCGVRIKAVSKPSGQDPCGCGIFGSMLCILIAVGLFSFALSNPQEQWVGIIGGLMFLGGGIHFFAKFPEAEICPACGNRLKPVPKPPVEDSCGCGQFLALFSILIGVVLLLVLVFPIQDPSMTAPMIIGGLIFLGGGVYFFARKYGWF